MRAMKDSGIEWIGQIPQEWSVGKTIFGLEIPITDGPHETPPLYSEGVPFVSAEAVSTGNGRINFDNIRGYISEEYYEECCKKYIPQKEDIYMIKSGATTGKIAIVDTDDVFTIWSPLAVFRCNKERCISRFLFYTLRSDYYQKQVESKWSFGTQQNIGMRTLERLLICYPPVPEQERIADYLDTKCAEIDALIVAKEKTNALLKERRQSIIYEAVTKGLNSDAPMKDSGIEWIGTIPQNSNIVRFKYLCDIFGRIGFRGYTQADIVAEGEGPITLSPSNIEAYGMDFSKCTYLTWDKYNESPEIQVGVGDILLVKTGSSYGKSAIIETIPMEATINPQLVVVKNIKCNARYLYYCMQTDCFAYQVERAVVGGTIPTMAQEKINNFIVVLPEDDLCEEIVVYLDQKCEEINRMVTANEATIQKLKEYRQSVIYEAVTGKIEV